MDSEQKVPVKHIYKINDIAIVHCHSINGPGISGPGGPFMLNIIGPPGPLMPKHKWSY